MDFKSKNYEEEEKILSFNASKDDSRISLFNKKESNTFNKLNNNNSKKENEKIIRSLSKSYREDQNSMILDEKKTKVFDKDIRVVGSENEEFDGKYTRNEGFRKLIKKEKICDTDTEDEGSDTEKTVKWILLPDDNFKKIWECVIAIIILYSSIVTPYKIAFIDQDNLVQIDILFDIILTIDIIVNFFSAYVDNEDNIVKNRKKIVITYLKTWFTIDIVSVLPIAYITENSFKYNNLSRIGKLPKLYRLLKLTKLLRMSRIAKKGNINRFTKFFLEKLKVNANIERLIYFILSFLLLNHLSACIWYFMAKLQEMSPDCWVTRLGFIDYSNFEIYVISFYWTLTTVTTVGYGDVNAGTTLERAYNLVIMSFGVLMYSFAIGSLSSIVSTLDAKTAEMNQKLQILSSIKKEFNLDQDIYDKVRKVIKYDLSRNQKDKMHFLQELPNKLRIELSQIMHDKVIQNLYFFRDQPNDFIAYVAPLLKPVKFSQNDYLYKQGDMIDEMYFVSKGTVILCLGKDYGEKEIKEIKKNNNFGEIEMCLNEKLSFNIKIKSRNCELFVLKKNDFLRLSVNFKEFIENFLHKSLMIYLKFNEEKKKIMKEEEMRMNKNNPDYAKKNENKIDLEIINEDKEDADLSEFDINSDYDSDKSETSTDKEEKDHDKNTNSHNEGVKVSKNSIDIMNSIQGSNIDINKKIANENLKSINEEQDDEEEQIQSGHDDTKNRNNDGLSQSDESEKDEPVDKMKNTINKKFIKKIDKILQYLEMNNINFNNLENNPKALLKQLRMENDILEKNNIIDKIENILKDFYKEQTTSKLDKNE